jgi:hypothetical protein
MRITPRLAPTIVTVAGVALFAGACTSTTGTVSTGAGSPKAVVSSSSAAASASASASEATGRSVDLQPGTAAPGSAVSVYGLTCAAATGTATSQAFTATVALSMLSNATGGIATVKPGLAAGQYIVTVMCGSITTTGTLTVS